MRTTACVLLTLVLGVSVRADKGDAPTVQQSDTEPGNKQTLVATIFGEPLYLEQLTPADIEIKRKELAAGKFDDWLREYHGRRAYENIWRAVVRRYVEREKLSVSDEELAAIAASVDRRLKSEPELPKDTTLSPAKHKGIMVAWASASLVDWKVCKSLYEKYGGRVGIGSLGSWTAFDGQNALLREHHNAGEIKFHHAEMEEAFWQHTKIKNFADAYPTGERLKRLLAAPPYLKD